MYSIKRYSLRYLQSSGQLGRARSTMSSLNEIFMGETMEQTKVDQVNRVRVMIRRRAMIITEINRRRMQTKTELEVTLLLVKLNWNLMHSEKP